MIVLFGTGHGHGGLVGIAIVTLRALFHQHSGNLARRLRLRMLVAAANALDEAVVATERIIVG